MNEIIKRDGRKVPFNKAKIESAILKAFIAVDGNADQYAISKASNIANYIESKAMETTLSIEEIQDLVVHGLMSTKRKDVAEEYVEYRYQRSLIRNNNTPVMKDVIKKLMGDNDEKQNANVDAQSFGGRKGEAADSLFKSYALDNLMSPVARANHVDNFIYTHDLGSYPIGDHNCLSCPVDDLFANGFNTRQTDVRGASTVNTEFQLLAVIFQLQSLGQFGGVSATHIDHSSVPYVRKSFMKHYMKEYIKSTDEFASLNLLDMIFNDITIVIDKENGITMERNEFDDWFDNHKSEFLNKLNLTEEDFRLDNKENLDPKFYQAALFETVNETKQAVEGMYHNLNTLQSRSGDQLPFTSINYGTCTSLEGRLVIRALLEGSKKGVGKLHKTSVFPCGIFQYMKGVNDRPGTPNYDLYRLALKSTSTRLYPNYANVDWSGNAGYDRNDPRTYFSTMGCRTANGYDINAEPGQNPQLKDGRGNICPVTIIMPSIAMETKLHLCEDEDLIEEFIKNLDIKIHEAKDGLIDRFNYIASQSPASAKFMYENNLMYGYKPEEGIRSALKHGTLAIGQIGLAETLEILIGCDHTTDKGMKLAKRIEQLFKDRASEFKNEYKLNFGVYYTPAENLCYTSMTKFKNKYGVIENVSDKDYFTNSIHVPVYKKVSPFEKIDIESQLTGYSSAGCITYVELDGTLINNIDALESIVNYAMEHDIPYFAINIPNDTCLDCGFTGEFNDSCPVCGSNNIQQLRRVTGYLTGNYKTAFNYGKQKETEDRVRHSTIINKINGFNVNFNDFVNGEDVSVSVFMNGCTHHCKECFNKELWEFTNDIMSDDTIEKILSHITDNGIVRNLSILGGEPLDKMNLNNTKKLIEEYRKRFPNGQIYLWTGYYYNELDKNNPDIEYILNNINVLIDGPFENDKKDLRLHLRGSSNQNIIRFN